MGFKQKGQTNVSNSKSMPIIETTDLYKDIAKLE